MTRMTPTSSPSARHRAVQLARRQLGRTLRVLDNRAPTTVRRAARDIARNVAGDRFGRELVSIVLTASDDDVEYLGEALRSAVDQSHRSLEILVVPYGTAERLPAAAKGWLGADHRIRFVRAVAPSLPAARDRGAALAKGRYLCFLRGHDTLPKDAVAGAFTALHRSGSDFAVGRMTAPTSLLPSVLPCRDAIHDQERLHTTLSEFPTVITDMSLGNRMFSADFWRSAALSFRTVEGETQLVLQCFETGRAFDVIAEPTYTERTRGDASPVEQMYDSTADLPGWLRDATAVGQHLRRLGNRLYDHWLVGVCDNQLQHFLGDAERMSEELWQELRTAVTEFRYGVEEPAWKGLRAESRVKLALLVADRRQELEEFVAARWFERDNVPTMIESGNIYACLPYFDDAAVGLDRSVFALHDLQTPARMQLRSLRSGPDDRLQLDLLVHIELLDLAGEQPLITARLVPGDGTRPDSSHLIDTGGAIGNGQTAVSGSDISCDTSDLRPVPIDLPVRPDFDDQANLTLNHRYQDYRPGGCTVEIDRNAVPRGVWHLETTITAAGIRRSTDLITVDRRGAGGLLGTRHHPVHNTVTGTAVWIGQHQRRLVLDVKNAEPVAVATVSVNDRAVRLRLLSDAGPLSAITAHCSGVRTKARVVEGVAHLQLPELAEASPIWQLRAIGDDGVAYPLRWPVAEPWLAVGEGELVATRTEWGNTMLVEAAAVVELDRVQVRSGAVRVSGHWLGNAAPDDLEMIVRGPRHETRHPLHPDGERGFEFDVPLKWDPWGLGEVGIPRGEYTFSVVQAGTVTADRQPEHQKEPASRARRVWAGPGFVDSLRNFEITDEVRMRPLYRRGGAIGFSLSVPLPIQHSGAYPQQQLQQSCLDGMGPIDSSLVYFSSYDGAQPTDSGLAIHHELRRRYPKMHSVWGVSDPRTPVPDGASAVVINSREWYQVLSTAGYLVQNVDFPRWWRKRPGQKFLQTFHGYPAKSMGLRMWRAKEFSPRRLQHELDRTMAGWDLILTPAPEMDEYYRREYAYQGAIHNQGYPRDDALVLPSAPERRELVRRLLGIRPDQKAILYAPTWRDHLASSYQSAAMVDNLDVASASAELGADYVLLLRGHRFTSRSRSAGPRTTRIIDLTDYPEINDLILAADAAVLDYSSLRFDFALTGRPMVFLVPDLDEYVGGIRGFLFDYTDTAPGPLTRTADEAVRELRDLDGLATRYRERIAEFNAKYQYLQDGHAAERVARRFFGGDQSG